jgi:enoyl-CoA hydratase/carnithine racemase
MLKGTPVSPEEAVRLGMITGSFKKDKFHAKVQEFADAMSKRPPHAISGIKKAVHQGLEAGLTHALSIELEESVRCFSLPLTHEIMKAYNEYIRETIEAPNVKPTTIRDAVAHLESDEFLKSLDAQ